MSRSGGTVTSSPPGSRTRSARCRRTSTSTCFEPNSRVSTSFPPGTSSSSSTGTAQLPRRPLLDDASEAALWNGGQSIRVERGQERGVELLGVEHQLAVLGPDDADASPSRPSASDERACTWRLLTDLHELVELDALEVGTVKRAVRRNATHPSRGWASALQQDKASSRKNRRMVCRAHFKRDASQCFRGCRGSCASERRQCVS
jgi:hypothetical protein